MDYYSALDIIGEYGDYDYGYDSNGKKGYYPKDIVRKAMPSIYHHTNSDYDEGYWAEDIVREAMPSTYKLESGEGYWAEDIVRELMPDAYEIYSNK